MAETGGRPPGGGKKASSEGGLWGFLGKALRNTSFEFNVGAPAPKSAKGDPTDPAARINGVQEDRRETYDEMMYRTTEGEQGQAPAVRVNRERQHVARSLDTRMGAGGGGHAPIPEAGGEPLSKDVRSRMEPRLGADLSGVRVHTSGESAGAAESMSAKAFTTGSDVHFGKGNYQPGTKEGDRLIAHELTHVVQGQQSGIQRKAEEPGGEHAAEEGSGATVSDPGEPAELEADAVADHVADDLHAGKAEGASEHDGSAKKEKGGGAGKGSKGKQEKKDAAPADAAASGAGGQQDHGGDHGGGAEDGKPAAGKPSATPTAPIGRKVVLPKRIAITAAPPTLGRKAIFRAASAGAATAKTPSTGTNPHAGKLKGDPVAFVKQACAGDKIAMQKIQDVEGERDIQDVPPKTAAGNFFKLVADNINNEANLDVKHAYSTAGFQQAAAPYLKMGRKIDKSKITGLCSRTIRIENWWRFNCNQAQFLKQADQVTKGKVKGKEREELAFSLMKLELSENPGAALGTLDRSKPIQPSGMHGWFTDDKVKLEPGKDAGFSQLLHVFALQPEVFAEGTVFIEIAPKGLEGDVRKPTAYDGMQSSLWVPRPGDVFGVTGGGLREFLADSIKGSAVQTANARVPNSGLAAEIKKYNDDTKGATGSASATDAAVRGEKGAKQGGKGKATTDSVVATTQHEREHPSPARGPHK